LAFWTLSVLEVGMSVEITLQGLAQANEAAQLTGMSRERIVRKIHNGELEGVRIADRWFVRLESLARLLEAQRAA
jgi:excisionase family DNA binding protein